VISGSFEFIMATRAANTGVKFYEEDYAFKIDFIRRPFPLSKFSSKSSFATFRIFYTLTLFIMPLILFLSISHIYF
jgi:hypothetical protein